jgi:hypothetical protein
MNWFKSFWKALTQPMPAEPHVSVQPGNKPRIFSGPTETSSDQVTNLTPHAQKLLGLARKEADRFSHNFVGTEHLLLGLIRLDEGVAVIVLKRMGLDLATIRSEVEAEIGTGTEQKMIGNIPYTPRVKKVLALAAREAKALNHTYVGTEHILLGLLREGDNVAARVLKNLDVDIEQTRQEILKELDPNFTPPSDATKASRFRSPVSTRDIPEPFVDPKESDRESVDLSKSYDVSCLSRSGEITVYPNVRFKGTKHLFEIHEYDAGSIFVELEESDARTFFVARSSILKFCEHVAPSNPPSDSTSKS